MGVFRQFPYSNFHEMNMDEIIKVVKDMLEEWAQYHAQWDQWQGDINQAWQDMQDFINNYFDNLDVQQEINNKIIEMVNSGEFGQIVQPYIPAEVADWLAIHITQPVGVVIDTSLSVAGACADAKATGDAFNSILTITDTLEDSIYDEQNLNPTVSSAGWRLNENDGLCSTDAAYKLLKFPVVEGDMMKIVSDDRFQFQNNVSVPTSPPDNRIGATYSNGVYYLEVPAGATYLVISTPTSGIGAASLVFDKVEDIDEELHLEDRNIDITWEVGRINTGDGSDQASTTYTRTVGYLALDSFSSIKLAEKCQIEVFFYNASNTKISSKIYGSSTSPEMIIIPDRPYGAVKVRATQYLHNTQWQTTVANSYHDIQFLAESYVKKAIDLAESNEYTVGIKSKDITVPANSTHSADVELDKIYLDDFHGNCYLSVKSENEAIRTVQAWGYTSDNSGSALVSFYSDGKRTGTYIDSSIVAIGFTIVNTASNVQDTFTASIETIDAFTVNLEKESQIPVNNNARHIPAAAATPLTLFHFSDIHADKVVMNRFNKYLKDRWPAFDDAICTGDMVTDTYESITSWWNPKIMTCIGNHDCANESGGVYNWTALNMAGRDSYYIAPFESNWDVTHVSGTSYYYKDYASSNVRLIVMDDMLYNDNGPEATTQTSWLSSLLDDAISNGLHVIIAIHAPHGGSTAVECSFSRYGQTAMPTYTDCNTPQTIIDLVATKISNGLNFVGYLVGHTHQDNVWDPENNGSQYMYCITCAAVYSQGLWTNSDQDRRATQDAFNLVTIDTANTLVKIVRGGGADIDDHMRTRKAICFNYSTGEKVGEVL